MSDSRRRTPIGSWSTAGSEKRNKRWANRALRARVRALLRQGRWDVLPRLRDVSDVWDFAKDGKRWFGWKRDEPDPRLRDAYEREMRR